MHVPSLIELQPPSHPHPRGHRGVSQSFIERQDELSVLEFMRKYGMPERINEEVRRSVTVVRP